MIREGEFPQGLTRRDLFKLAALAGGGYTALRGSQAIGEHTLPAWSQDLTVLPPQVPVPSALLGLSANFPYFYRWIDNSRVMDRFWADKEATGIRYVRQFPPSRDAFEPELGSYRFDLLENIPRSAELIPAEFNLIDGYWIFHSEKGDWSYKGKTKPNSAYLKPEYGSLKDQRLAFFTNDYLIGSFIKRAVEMINYLRGARGIIAFSIGNEIEPPVDDLGYARELVTTWYSKVAPPIKEVIGETPILSGLSDPDLLDANEAKKIGLAADTFHVFPHAIIDGKINRLAESLKGRPRQLPLICQEIGFYSRLERGRFTLTIPSEVQDIMFSWMLDYVFSKFSEVNQIDGWKRGNFGGVGIWRFTFEGNPHDDGFDFTPRKLPKSLETLFKCDDFLQASSLASNVA